MGAGTFKILALLKLAFHIFFELARSPTNSDIDRMTANFVLSDESLLSGWIDTDWPLEKESQHKLNKIAIVTGCCVMVERAVVINFPPPPNVQLQSIISLDQQLESSNLSTSFKPEVSH